MKETFQFNEEFAKFFSRSAGRVVTITNPPSIAPSGFRLKDTPKVGGTKLVALKSKEEFAYSGDHITLGNNLKLRLEKLSGAAPKEVPVPFTENFEVVIISFDGWVHTLAPLCRTESELEEFTSAVNRAKLVPVQKKRCINLANYLFRNHLQN
ncbi:MAG: hypothetical protein IJ184_01180 [Alphaproteobacteria bacterium]|nr:hypothetical protein [Alphaproteobacteria bacterium]